MNSGGGSREFHAGFSKTLACSGSGSKTWRHVGWRWNSRAREEVVCSKLNMTLAVRSPSSVQKVGCWKRFFHQNIV